MNFKYYSMQKLIAILFFLSPLFISSCINQDPNVDEQGQAELKSLELDHQVNTSEMAFQDLIYVPIYSDIYVDIQNQKSLLAATLSIRNTSSTDSLVISKIDY